MTPPALLERLIGLAAANPAVVVLWLYGSQAKGNAGPHSDWDLAVAFDPVKLTDLLENRLRPELLALDWQRALGLAEGQLSVVDINQAPVPLAFAIIDANRVLFCRDQGRRLCEEARIMSRMELDFSPRKQGMVTRGETMELASYRFLQQLAALPFVEVIWLFGSRARGDHRERSDIDLAIECPTASEAQWQQVLTIVEEADTLLPIDCIRLDAEPSHSPLYHAILRDKQLIYRNVHS